MMNTVTLVGRLTKNVEMDKKTEDRAYEVAYITIAVPRSFKNIDGEYETDFIPCRCFGNVAKSTYEYCEKGDILGIKGRIQSNEDNIEVIAEKISFLSNNPNIVNKEAGEE